MVSAADLHRLLVARREGAQRVLHAVAELASTVSGMSSGFWVTKYTPTPLERISRTTCSIFSSSAFGASLNSRCASSKKNTSFGLSRSPTSGRCSNSSDSSHSRKVA